MARRSIFDQPTVPRLFTLLEEVREGSLLIPKFQRPFVWGDNRRLMLLDSVSKGIPIGSLLVWHTREHKLDTFTHLAEHPLPLPPEEGTRTFLLDGHQRLGTLFAALNWGSEPVPGGAWPIWFDSRNLAFKLYRRDRPPPPYYVSLSKMFDSDALWDKLSAMREKGLKAEARQAETLAHRLKDYQIPVVPLISEDLDMVTDGFARINRQGKRMGESHMIHALGYSKLRVRDRTTRILATFEECGWGQLDEQLLINALKLRFDLYVYSAHPRLLLQALEALEAADLDCAFDDLRKSVQMAIDFLSKWGVHGPQALPAGFQLLALADAFRRQGATPVTPSAEENLKLWFWQTTFTGYFTGIKGRGIGEAVEHVSALMDGSSTTPVPDPDLVAELDNYLFRAIRTKARLLWMCRGLPRSERALAALGSGAVAKIHPALPAHPGAFVVCPPEDLAALRRAVMAPSEPSAAGVLERHYIPLSAAAALKDGAYEDFLQRRSEFLDESERTFIEDELGLGIVDSART